MSVRFLTIAGALALGLLVGPRGEACGGVMVMGVSGLGTATEMERSPSQHGEQIERPSLVTSINGDSGQMTTASTGQNAVSYAAVAIGSHHQVENDLQTETRLALESHLSLPDPIGHGLFRPPRAS